MILDKKSAQMIIDGLNKLREELIQKSYRASCRYGELLGQHEKNTESIHQAYVEALTTQADVKICLRLQEYIYREFMRERIEK